MAKKKTVQNLKVGIFNDMAPQTSYGLVQDVAPKWAQTVPEKDTTKKLSKARATKKGPSRNSGHRE